ncbi:MAG: Na+/H+ antiporter NhaA [Leptospiraceae bacterium]|jgi:NhaA family Na+:H+ antiporter|nr:Na+/H+ antiporter NhaA [Leptospiraceae bacterium]MCZ8344862.1 Na+/H+ antiporter NhaA [Leptospiraceae bacterium]PJE01587.1 MAG: Na+/H+ antiporter NhaA [Leptospira sp.]
MRIIGKVAEVLMEKPIYKITSPFRWFAGFGAAGGFLLLLCSVVAMIWANSPFYESYFEILETKLSFSLGSVGLSKGLILWINDALMAVFFFVVGLEIKREFLVGELSKLKKALLPLIAALGGMIVPALFYFWVNPEGAKANGWGIPMATDIAFALGFLALLGDRVPNSLKVFLTALAIVDDIGAVLVIGLFYTDTVVLIALGLAILFFAILIAGNALGIRTAWFYLIVGIFLWLAFLKSGIHATVAGVLAAFTIPARTLFDRKEFVRESKNLLYFFEENESNNKDMISAEQESAVNTLEAACESVIPPLLRLEHAIFPWVTFAIMPIFALANAGVRLEKPIVDALSDEVTLGIIAGLVLGKPIGIFFFSWLAVKSKLADLPSYSNWRQILGAGFLGGIGFTMSIFIAGLAFKGELGFESDAKIGILTGSLLSALIGMALLFKSKKD